MKQIGLLYLVLLLCVQISSAQTPVLGALDSTYRMFDLNQKLDLIIIGNKGNVLWGTPEFKKIEDPNFPAYWFNPNFLKTNYKEVIDIFDEEIPLQRAEELFQLSNDGQISITLCFLPGGLLKEVYFGFWRYGHSVPLSHGEIRAIESSLLDRIKGWFDDEWEKQVWEGQNYIVHSYDIRVDAFLKYKKGMLDRERFEIR